MGLFYKNKRQIYGIAVFQEFIKELYASLFTKEMLLNMIESYEEAYLEDVKLECAMASFKDFNSSYMSWYMNINLFNNLILKFKISMEYFERKF